jgi:streptogramin lyase
LQTPDGVWCAADGALWCCDTEAARLVRFDPAGSPGDEGERWSFFGAGRVRGPFDIKAGVGAGEQLWFTDKVGNAVGRIET